MNTIVLLESCLQEFADQNELKAYKEDELFELFCGLELTKDADTDFSEVEDGCVDGGNDGGIDTFLIFLNDKSVATYDEVPDLKLTEKSRLRFVLIQSKTAKSFSEKVLDKLYIALPFILDLGLQEESLTERFNAELIEKIKILRHTWISATKKKAAIEFQIAYACKAEKIEVNAGFESKRNQILSRVAEYLPSAARKFDLFSARELVNLYNQKPPLELQLTFNEGPIPILYRDDKYGYVGTVTLAKYYEFIKDESGSIREQLFESNIRHFQGDADVNRKIAETLKTDEKNDFWWLNNGITIISASTRPVPKSLFLTDAQVVNGLQTSFAIFNSFGETPNPDHRSILVKIIQSNDKQTTDAIIEATNHQNAVPPVLLRATDEVQRSIEQFFSSKGYYYDRRKGFYKNQGKPVTRIFNIQDVAQAMEAVLFRSPSVARKNPTTIIKSNESYQRIFCPDTDFTVFLRASQIVRRVKILLNTSTLEGRKSFLRNFTYHISLVLTNLLTGDVNFKANDIGALDADAISAQQLEAALKILDLALETYVKETGENPLNIAKSGAFDQILAGKK